MRQGLLYLLLLALAVPAHAETLPLSHLDVADGLADSRVTAIVQAGRGDLWFSTWDGVSRYDGYRFTNYGTRDGLPEHLISSIAADRDGGLWFGTFSHGVARLIDDPKERGSDPSVKFETFSVGSAAGANGIGALVVDAKNRLWCATNAGVFRAELRGPRPPRFEEILPGATAEWPQLLAVDPQGRAWVGDVNAVVEIGDGAPIRHTLPPEAQGEL